MQLSALLFVNWIFWAALSAGTLLVVGLTEVLGGTTRGYRLFMAWMLVVFAAILVASDLGLPPGVEASATVDVRRPLAIAFAAGCVAYLVASIARWPRSWLAIGTAVVGLTALVVLAAAGGSRSAPLFAGQLVLAALALGAVNAAMLLGHWYLVTPKLSERPLRLQSRMLLTALIVQALLFVVWSTLGGGVDQQAWEALSGSSALLVWLRGIITVLFPVVLAYMALRTAQTRSMESATGLLYIALAAVLAGTIGAAALYVSNGILI